MNRIAIHSVPRSGSSWLGQIINSSPSVNFSFQPLFSYAFKDRLNLKSSQLEITQFFKEIAESNDPFINQTEEIKKGIYPSFIKAQKFTHIAYKEVRYHNLLPHLMQTDKNLRVIGLIRNPLAVLNSWFGAPKEFRFDLGWKIKDEWEKADKKNLNRHEEFFGYEKWKELTLQFHDLKILYPDRFHILKYSDLIKDPIKAMQECFAFSNIEWNDQTNNFITESISQNNLDTYSVYKITTKYDSKWKGKLDDEIESFISSDLDQSILSTYLD